MIKFIIIVAVVSMTAAKYEPGTVELENSIDLRRESTKIAYEGTVPIHFKLRVPRADGSSISKGGPDHDCTGKPDRRVCGYVDKLQPMINLVYHNLEHQMLVSFPGKSPLIKYAPSEKRAKRGILDSILSFCCGVPTRTELLEVQMHEKAVENYVQKMDGGIHKNHKGLLMIQNEITGLAGHANRSIAFLTRNMNELMKTLKTDIQAFGQTWEDNVMYALTGKIADLISIIHTNLIVNSYHQLAAACENSRLSALFVDDLHLSQALEKIQIELRKHDKELAIPPNLLHTYRHLPLTQCIFGHEYVMVNLRVPFVTIGKLWEIYRLKPIPMANGKETRVLDVPSAMVARSGNEVVAMDLPEYMADGNCKENLCKIPEDRSSLAEYQTCLNAVFKKASVTEIRDQCSFKGIPTIQSRVTKVSPYIVYITHTDKEANMVCISEGRKIVDPLPRAPEYGSLKVTLKCGCRLESNGKIIAEPSFPCSSQEEDNASISQTVPAAWTKLNNTILEPPGQQMETITIGNFTAVKDLPWVPDILETIPDEMELPAEAQIPTPVSGWVRIQFSRETTLLWTIWFMLMCLTIFHTYEICRLRDIVNKLAMAAMSFEMIPTAAAQADIATQLPAFNFPSHLEAAILMTLFLVTLTSLPKLARWTFACWRKFHPRYRNARVNMGYHPWNNRSNTGDSRITTESLVSNTSENPVYGPTVQIATEPATIAPTTSSIFGQKRGLIRK